MLRTSLSAATAALDPADRALLTLWLGRTLDDVAISELAGGTPERIAGRRRDIVVRLAAETGEEPQAVFDELVVMARGSGAAAAHGEQAPAARATGTRTPAQPTPAHGRRFARDVDAPAPATPMSSTVTGAATAVGATAPVDVPSATTATVAPVVDRQVDDTSRWTPATLQGAPEVTNVRSRQRSATAVDRLLEALRAARPSGASGPVRPSSSPVDLRAWLLPGGGLTDRQRAKRNLVLACVACAIIAILGFSHTPSSAEPAADAGTTTTASTDPRPESPVDGRLRIVGTSAPHATGTVAVVGSGDGAELQVEATGLAGSTGRYEVWLFNSVSDSRLLGRLDDDTLALPADARRYGYVDVSYERPDGNPNHSGRSVLRTALPDIPR